MLNKKNNNNNNEKIKMNLKSESESESDFDSDFDSEKKENANAKKTDIKKIKNELEKIKSVKLEIKKSENEQSVSGSVSENDGESEKENNDIKNKIWEHIFKEINYDYKTEITITSNTIKNAKKSWKGKSNQFEPRLLCKHDTNDEKPNIFKKNNLCILSIKNGTYLLTKENIYINLQYDDIEAIKLKKCEFSELLNLGDSESSMIDNLRYNGIFEGKFYLNEKIEYGSLLNGRHRCSFKTKLGGKYISISGSQFETDACYESKNKILLIECKSKKINNFNIRQIYYPYRFIYDQIKNKKKIIPIFICKDKEDYIHMWKYDFENPEDMMSIKKIGYNKYKFID